MDGRWLNQAFDDTFATWIGSDEAVKLHRSLWKSYETLTRFASLKEALAFLRDGKSEDYENKDAVLRAFVETYQAEAVPHRSAQLLLGALQPGLSHLFNQQAGRWPGLEEAEL